MREALDQVEGEREQAVGHFRLRTRPLHPGAHGLDGGVSGVEPDRDRGTLLGDELVKGLEAAARARLDLDRNDATVERGDVVHLRVRGAALPEPVRELAVGRLREQILEVLADELFRHRALVHEPGLLHALDGAPAEAAHRVHQADVHEEELVDPGVPLRLEGQPVAVAVNHLRQHPRHHQQLDAVPGRRRRILPGEVDELDLPPDVAGGEVEHVDDARKAPRADVLGKVFPIRLDDGVVDGGDLSEATGARVCVDRLRHAPGEEVGSQPIEELVVERGVHASFELEGVDDGGKARTVHGAEELREGHRPHVQVAQPTDRHGGPAVGKREVEERSGRQHRQIAHVLAEVAKRRDGLRDGLDLVEEEQPVGADGTDAGQCFEDVQEICGVVAGKRGGKVGVSFEVDFGERALAPFGEQPHQGGLPHLPGAAQDQRLAVWTGEPVFEEFELLAIHAWTCLRYRDAGILTEQGCVQSILFIKQRGVLSSSHTKQGCVQRKSGGLSPIPGRAGDGAVRPPPLAVGGAAPRRKSKQGCRSEHAQGVPSR